ncbi:Uu.00g126140.m01.CDS01 [Anthostomella pinea]|uniref:Uu.00g126140.m01.CDS01 n=1 Tax=Anthostomella pinea TaxID=933095 RepID=A0AAI8YHN3_9PEZI|nr:Uu.00g126140.m01.CDS01 [Anthostomella pinea]
MASQRDTEVSRERRQSPSSSLPQSGDIVQQSYIHLAAVTLDEDYDLPSTPPNSPSSAYGWETSSQDYHCPMPNNDITLPIFGLTPMESFLYSDEDRVFGCVPNGPFDSGYVRDQNHDDEGSISLYSRAPTPVAESIELEPSTQEAGLTISPRSEPLATEDTAFYGIGSQFGMGVRVTSGMMSTGTV